MVKITMVHFMGSRFKFFLISFLFLMSACSQGLYDCANASLSPVNDVLGLVDMDGDGIANGYAIDEDGDGDPDGIDSDGDGLIDTGWSGGYSIMTDEECVAGALRYLEITYSGSDSAESVTADVTLSSTGENDTIVTWSTSNTGYITSGGAVTRNMGNNTAVTLAATVSKNDYSETKEFFLTVITLNPDTAPSLTAANASIDVSWSSFDQASSYQVYYNTTNDSSTATCFASGITTTGSTITGLVNDVTYYVWVKGQNPVSTSSFSPSSSATPVVTETNAALTDTLHCTVGTITFNMVYANNTDSITFPMGESDTSTGTIRVKFFMGETEVTYKLWNEVHDWALSNSYTFAYDGREGQDGTDGADPTNNEPVTYINWRDMIVWCNALTEYYNSENGTSCTCVYYTDPSYSTPLRTATGSSTLSSTTPGSEDCPYIYAAVNGNTDMSACTATGYRLPTTVEWEYAARYLGTSAPSTGDDLDSEVVSQGVNSGDSSLTAGYYWTPGDYTSGAYDDNTDTTETQAVSWGGANSGSDTQEVALKRANALGLYDMSGNVYERLFDWYGAGTTRFEAGGCWNTGGTAFLDVGKVNGYNPYQPLANDGFRISKSAARPSAITFSNALFKEKVSSTVGSVSYNMVCVNNCTSAITFPAGTNDSTTGTVSTPFFLGNTEVTYKLWYEVYTWAAGNGYTFAHPGCEGNGGTAGAEPASNEPVTTISWRDAVVWCNALTEYYNSEYGTAYTCVYYSDSTYSTPLRDSYDSGNNPSNADMTDGYLDNPYIYDGASGNTDMENCTATGFRLASKNEWEYSARYINDLNGDGDITVTGEYYPFNYPSGADANNTTTTGGSDYDGDGDVEYTTDVAWYDSNSSSTTHDVALKSPNALGLYDMSGNVYEFCAGLLNASTGVRYFQGGKFDSLSLYLYNVSEGNYSYAAFDWAGFRIAKTR